jgi:adenylate cyclase
MVRALRSAVQRSLCAAGRCHPCGGRGAQNPALAGNGTSTETDRPPGGNLDAYNTLLQGRFYEARDTEADIRKAIEQYTAATHLDPHYALAWSLLSRAWVSLGENYLGGAAMLDANAKARAAADTALTLAPDLAAAHMARGFVLQDVDLDQRGA